MRITSKGQVTIPQAIREQAGLRPGSEVEFVMEGGKVVIGPVRPAARTWALERARGSGNEPMFKGWDHRPDHAIPARRRRLMSARSRRAPRLAEPSAAYLAPRPVMADSNVQIDVIDNIPRWVDWSLAQLEAAMVGGGLVINPIIYAEISTGFVDGETLQATIAPG